MSSAPAISSWRPALSSVTPPRRMMAETKDRTTAVAPTSYLRVDGASIVDGSGTPVRLQGHCLGGWMNMENFITGYPATETLQRRALLKAKGPETDEPVIDHFLPGLFSEADAPYPDR